jgi:HEAT repeat protein
VKSFAGQSKTRRALQALALAVCLCAGPSGRAADGFLDLLWGQRKVASEPAQKAIVIHSGGRETLILQLRSEGGQGPVGWLVPVPAAPEIENVSMEPFYEASRLSQQPLYPDEFTVIPEKMELYESVQRIKEVRINRLETTRSDQPRILSDAEALNRWIAANHFDFSKDQATLEAYARRGWQFVAVRANLKPATKPGQTNSPATEVAPLRLSFACPKPILPLALASNRRAPLDVACLTFSAEPMLSPAILAKAVAARRSEYEEWQANGPMRRMQREEGKSRQATDGMVSQMTGRDPALKAILDERLHAAVESWHSHFQPGQPWDVFRSQKRLLQYVAVKADQLSECRQAARALAESNQWYLAYHPFTAEASPAEALEFTPAIPVLTELLQQAETALDAADLLAPLEPKDVPALRAAAHSADPTTRLAAAQVLSKCKDAPPNDFWLELVKDPDDKVRGDALSGLGRNLDATALDKLFVYLRDPKLCRDVAGFLGNPHHYQALASKKDELLQLTRNADPDVQSAAWRLLLPDPRFELPREVLVGLLKSTNFFIINTAVARLQKGGLSSEEASVLVHSPSPFARFASVRVLSKNADGRAIELGTELLRDPEELIRIEAWQTLRKITGQDLPYDQPEMWEAWWAAQKARGAAPSSEHTRAKAGSRQNQ